MPKYFLGVEYPVTTLSTAALLAVSQSGLVLTRNAQNLVLPATISEGDSSWSSRRAIPSPF